MDRYYNQSIAQPIPCVVKVKWGMTLDISRIKALCFDVDGTLSDTDDVYVHKVRASFPRFLFKDPITPRGVS
jgi:hypothetical protein